MLLSILHPILIHKVIYIYPYYESYVYYIQQDEWECETFRAKPRIAHKIVCVRAFVVPALTAPGYNYCNIMFYVKSTVYLSYFIRIIFNKDLFIFHIFFCMTHHIWIYFMNNVTSFCIWQLSEINLIRYLCSVYFLFWWNSINKFSMLQVINMMGIWTYILFTFFIFINEYVI